MQLEKLLLINIVKNRPTRSYLAVCKECILFFKEVSAFHSISSVFAPESPQHLILETREQPPTSGNSALQRSKMLPSFPLEEKYTSTKPPGQFLIRGRDADIRIS